MLKIKATRDSVVFLATCTPITKFLARPLQGRPLKPLFWMTLVNTKVRDTPKKSIKSAFTYLQYHNGWAVCCTDGHVFGPLAGVSKILLWLTRGSKVATPRYWQFATWGTGAAPSLVLTPGRRVRLDNHKCDPVKDCNNHGTCNARTGKFLVKQNTGCTLTCPSGYKASGKTMCVKGHWQDAACIKDTPQFPDMLCRCTVSQKSAPTLAGKCVKP
eukprot:NODE_142_length_1360_cov_262.461476_g138_i0.p1 GENE.NODE_142_length_1360_cov_262.461476_g138_i0~~NODE_142_length_1360_cov_262.461476_g138_i0.p1  ORF type:complete len:215 (+),score=32.89 NODE_142_length_1360_cov_262.461476_g138_i0:247-891(+)